MADAAQVANDNTDVDKKVQEAIEKVDAEEIAHCYEENVRLLLSSELVQQHGVRGFVLYGAAAVNETQEAKSNLELSSDTLKLLGEDRLNIRSFAVNTKMALCKEHSVLGWLAVQECTGVQCECTGAAGPECNPWKKP